jgi:cell division protein FtsB
MTTRFMALSCAEVDPSYADFRERHDATLWQRLNRIMGVFLVVAVWLAIISLFVPPYKRLMRSRSEIDNLQTQVNEQKLLLGRHTREVSLLQTNPTYLETIARDRLDLMKEGETIFHLEPAKSDKRKRENPVRR